MNKVENPAKWSKERLDAELEKGYNDMLKGRTRPAAMDWDFSEKLSHISRGTTEAYYPYGDTSYRAGRNASEVSRKRYRYTGKEKCKLPHNLVALYR